MFEKKFEIRYSETDETGTLSASGLLRIFQDVGYFHALERGQGNTPVRTGTGISDAPRENRDRTWYLLSWHVESLRMPVCGETVTAGTWICSSGGPIAVKQLVLLGEDGEVLAGGETLWVYMDVVAEAPTDPPTGVWGADDYGEKIPMERPVKRLHACKPTDLRCEQLPRDTVDGRLLDINHHANNVLLTEYAMSLAGKRTGCRFLAAEFRRQAKAGAVLCPYRSCDDCGVTVTLYGTDGIVLATFRFE